MEGLKRCRVGRVRGKLDEAVDKHWLKQLRSGPSSIQHTPSRFLAWRRHWTIERVRMIHPIKRLAQIPHDITLAGQHLPAPCLPGAVARRAFLSSPLKCVRPGLLLDGALS
jgi:hypothetical protein